MTNRNLSMTWIDYKKAYDIVPQSWIIDCLETVGINEKIRRLLTESTKLLRVELTGGEENMGEVNIRQGIFCASVTTYTHLKRCCTRISFASNGQKLIYLCIYL